jgi:nicotinamidase-related amidase
MSYEHNLKSWLVFLATRSRFSGARVYCGASVQNTYPGKMLHSAILSQLAEPCSAALILFAAMSLFPGTTAAQNIVDEWSAVEIPPPPELHRVTVTPETTALLVMGLVNGSCNMERRPRCVATIPAVQKLLEGARAHGVLIMFSVPTNDPTGLEIVDELARLPGEELIPPNGPNKFLPYDQDFNRFEGLDLDSALRASGIETIITVGTQVQTAVLHSAAEAALRGFNVIVPIDGMSGDTAYSEQYTAWHLANTQRVMQRVTLTRVDLIDY